MKKDVTWFVSGANKCYNLQRRNCGGVCLFRTRGNEELLSFKHYNCKLWLGGTVIVTFSDAVVTLNVLTASNNEAEKLVETRTVHFA